MARVHVRDSNELVAAMSNILPWPETPATDALGRMAAELRDMQEFDRRARAAEVAEIDADANSARFGAHNSLVQLSDQIANSGVQLWAEDALVLIHAVWKLAHKNSNQHLYVWESFNTELEGVMAAMQEKIEEDKSE